MQQKLVKFLSQILSSVLIHRSKLEVPINYVHVVDGGLLHFQTYYVNELWQYLFYKIKLLEWRVEKATVEATRRIPSRSCLIPSPLGAVTELRDRRLFLGTGLIV